MKTPIRFLALLLVPLIFLATGGQVRASAFYPSGDKVKIVTSSSSIGTNSTATLTVVVTRPDGTPETGGTTAVNITAMVTPPGLGSIAGVNYNGGTTSSGSSSCASVGNSGSTSTTTGYCNTSTLVGGMASFTFLSGNTPGTVTITIIVPPVNNYPTSITASTTITVTPAVPSSGGITLSATSLTLPQNPHPVGYLLGLTSPYVAEVTVQWRSLVTGMPVTSAPTNTSIPFNVAITPTQIAGFTMPVNISSSSGGSSSGCTTTVNGASVPTLLSGYSSGGGSGGTSNTCLGGVTAGIGTVYVQSSNIPGTATLTFSGTDPDTGLPVTAQLTFTVVAGGSSATDITLSQNESGVYVNGANGPHSVMLTAQVTDSAHASVADPAPRTDNIYFGIAGPAGSDATLSAVNAVTGTVQTGKAVNTATANGVANVTLLAGKVQGPVQIVAVIDGSDNNIDNGVTQPILATTSVIVSDGQLYSITLLPLSAPASSTTTGSTTATTTNSMTVTAIATDREGNPVLPGTPIRFGLIDTPQAPDGTSTCNGFGAFQICGTRGSPTLNSTYFSAPDGHFVSAGGGAGPGDTLIVFGKQQHGAPAGNDDLESALAISRIGNNTSLYTVYPFNRNDTTGAQVLASPLPYVVGRATIGTIDPAATVTDPAAVVGTSTTVTGTATATLNYLASAIQNDVIVYAQGTGPDINNPAVNCQTPTATPPTPGVSISASCTRTVTDNLLTTFAGGTGNAGSGVLDIVINTGKTTTQASVTLTSLGSPQPTCLVSAASSSKECDGWPGTPSTQVALSVNPSSGSGSTTDPGALTSWECDNGSGGWSISSPPVPSFSFSFPTGTVTCTFNFN